MPTQPGFYFQHSNDLEALAVRLGATVRSMQARSPLEPVSITVPHPGVGTWLKQYFAERSGATANLQFLQPTETVWQLAELAYGEERVRRARRLDAAALTMAAYATLNGWPHEPAGSATDVSLYLQRATGGGQSIDKARLGLARELAGLYRDYGIYRPHWIDAWSRGKQPAGLSEDRQAAWQGPLWQRIWQRIAPDDAGGNPGGLLHRLPRELAASGPGDKPLLLFGVTHLPPTFIATVAAACETRAVHLFMPNPCREYWAEERGERERLQAPVAELLDAPEDAGIELIPNDLLGSMGKQGQIFLGQISAVEDQTPEVDEVGYREPGEATRLGWLQRALLNLSAIEAPASVDDFSDDTHSIQLHDCHSRLREVEVLHDRVLAWLDRDGGVAARPRDILVIAPDIDAYAPHIRAIFGRSRNMLGRDQEQSLPELPFNISDRKAIDAQPLVQAFLDLLDLPASDFNAETVVAMLETPAIARRFGLDDAQLLSIRRWLADTHCHWGLDGPHRESLGGGADGANTWRHSIDRLLMGFASDHGEALIEGGSVAILPHTEVEGGNGETAGRLTLWINLLAALHRDLQLARRPADWQQFLNRRLLADLFDEQPSDRDESAALSSVRQALDELARSARRAGLDPADDTLELSWEVARDLLHQSLTGSLGSRRFLSRGITFANMVPLRSVPARIVCLLGMNSGEFPRVERNNSFDLLRRHPHRGDRSIREEDRYLFLETVMAARELLYISYVGHDQRDNAAIEPSPLVRELEDVMERAGLRLKPVRHPLQPFSLKSFDPDRPRRQSFHAEWLPAAEQMNRAGADQARMFYPPRPELPPLPDRADWPDVVQLAELSRFLGDPVAAYLGNVLGIRLQDRHQDLEAEFASGPLFNYDLGRYLVKQGLSHDGELPAVLPDPVERQRAWIPPGLEGREALNRNHHGALIAQLMTLEAGEESCELAIDLNLQVTDSEGQARPIRLLGQIDHYQPRRQASVLWTTAGFHGKRAATALPGWLALCVQQGEAAQQHIYLDKDGGQHCFAQITAEVATDWLADLLELYLRGQTGPVCLFPRAGWKTALGKAADYAYGQDTSYSDYAALLVSGWGDDGRDQSNFPRASRQVFRTPADYYTEIKP